MPVGNTLDHPALMDEMIEGMARDRADRPAHADQQPRHRSDPSGWSLAAQSCGGP
jgi:hypothetical protein